MTWLEERLLQIAAFAEDVAERDRETGWCYDIASDLRTVVQQLRDGL